MKTIIVFLFAFFLASCSPFVINSKGYSYLSMGLDEAWINTSQYEYIDDPDNYVKSPNEFVKDGGGDCEDFCIYLMYLLGPKSNLVCISRYDGNHYIVEYMGLYIEPQVYGMYYNYTELHILKIYTYDYTMRWSTFFGTKSLVL